MCVLDSRARGVFSLANPCSKRRSYEYDDDMLEEDDLTHDMEQPSESKREVSPSRWAQVGPGGQSGATSSCSALMLHSHLGLIASSTKWH